MRRRVNTNLKLAMIIRLSTLFQVYIPEYILKHDFVFSYWNMKRREFKEQVVLKQMSLKRRTLLLGNIVYNKCQILQILIVIFLLNFDFLPLSLSLIVNISIK